MSAYPSKYIPVSHSLIGVASLLAASMSSNDTVSSLWDRVRKDSRVRTFDRYAEALSLLFAGGMLQLESGVLRATQPFVEAP